MGELIQFPSTTADTTVWRGCWACGLVLFDDEISLCTDCDLALNGEPAPTPPGVKPIAFYLKPFGPDGIAQLAAAIVEAGVAHTEEQAAGWARDHHLDAQVHARYVGDVRGRAVVEYSDRCQRDAQQLGVQLGWAKADR